MTYETYATVPWYRKNWFVIVSILIVYLWPFLLLSMATGGLYYEKTGEVKETSKLAVIGFMAVIVVIAFAFGALYGDFNRE